MTDYEKKVEELRATTNRDLYDIYDTLDPDGAIMIKETLAWDRIMYYWYNKKDGSLIKQKEQRTNWGR